MKLLKTYGRKFKTSFDGKRAWSPEVVSLAPRRDRSEILFDSLCNPASKAQRRSNALQQTYQQCGKSVSQAVKNAKQKRRDVKRPATKLSLKSKKQQARQSAAPTSLLKCNAEQWDSSRLRGTSSGSSSCEVMRRHPQKADSSTSVNKPPAKRPPQLRGKVQGGDPDWSSTMNDTDSLNLSSLSGMTSTLMNTPDFPAGNSIGTPGGVSHSGRGIISPIALKENNGCNREEQHTTDSLTASFLVSGNRTNWVTTRKKRKECRHEGKENQERVRPRFEREENANFARGSNALENWSPFLASTPVSHVHAKGAKKRKEWLLNCALKTPAPLGILDSVLAPDSFTSRRCIRNSTAGKIRDGLSRKLSGSVQFQSKNCSNLSKKNAGSPVLKTSNDRRERRSPLSSCRRTEIAGTNGPPAHCEKMAKSSAALPADPEIKDLHIVLTDILSEVPITQSTSLSACSNKVDRVKPSRTKKSQRGQRKQCLVQSLRLASGNTGQQLNFEKELHVELVDFMKGTNPPESPQRAHSLFAQSDIKRSPITLENHTFQKKFHLKEAHIVHTDLTCQSTKVDLPDTMNLCSTPSKGEVQCVTCTETEGCDMQFNSSNTFAKLYLSCSTVADKCVKSSPHSSSKQYELHFVKHSRNKREKIISTTASNPKQLVVELSQMISPAACYPEAKLLQRQAGHMTTAGSKDNYHLGSLSAASRIQEIGSAVEQSALHLISPHADTPLKHHGHFGNLLQSGMAARRSSEHTSCRTATEFELLEELKVVLERCDHQLMQPPPTVVVKTKKPWNSQQSNCTLKQYIASPGHDLVEYQEPCKNDNWANCLKRQMRLTMARKSVVPSPLLLDASQALLEMCNQDEAYTFEQALGLRALRLCKKIGEGTFGEVFRIKRNTKASAVKIVPIEGSFPVNGEKQKTAAEILPEAIICQELSALCRQESLASCPNFIEVKRLYFVQDRYHEALLKQWDEYDSKRNSENERPDFFKADQKFLLFEFADGGISLEDYVIKSATVAKSIFLQVACALAVAETALEFEHRDLHWGNILVAPTKLPSIRYRLPQGDFEVDTNGVLVSLIDYTLSRMLKGGAVIFTDVSKDEDLFSGSGDYQFDIYRSMKEHNQNDWKSFRPYTNILWLHYLSRKLLETPYCARSRQQSSALAVLKQWSDALILECQSSREVFLKLINKQLQS